MNFLIPAAGKGTRSGLNYPKCLYKIEDKEIIVSILEKISIISSQLYKSSIVIILINKSDETLFQNVITKYKFPSLSIYYQYQMIPNGTASAVSLLLEAKELNNSCDNILIWSDCIGFDCSTLKKICVHKSDHDIIIPGLFMHNCYTYFKLNDQMEIIDCYETKYLNIKPDGFTDIGIFKISKKIQVKEIMKIYINSISKNIENSFIEFLKFLLIHKHNIKLLDICKESEKKGFNSLDDLN